MEISFLPPGFRFNPTDEELVVHYLKKKVLGRKMEVQIIGDVDIYKFEPSDLPGLSILPSKDREWYFFNIQDKKHLHGSRLNRTTRSGYWKATGKDRKVNVGNCTMAMKKTLIYYHGRAPNGQRTDWLMHEYRLDEAFEKTIMGKNRYVLCRIRKKGGPGPRNGEQYGAPILEVDEQDESDFIEVKQVPDAKIFENINQGTVTSLQASTDASLPLDSMEELDCPFDIISSFKQPVQIDVFDTVSASSDIDVISDTISRLPTGQLGNVENTMESLHDMLHPAEKEPEILEEILREITNEGEIGVGHMHQNDGLDSPVYFDILQDLDFGEFLELADLQSPNDESAADLPSPDLNVLEARGGQAIGIEPREHHRWASESMIDQGTADRRLRLQLEASSLNVERELSFKDRAEEGSSDESSSLSVSKHLDGDQYSSNYVTGTSSRKTMVDHSIRIPNGSPEILIGTSEVQNSGLVGTSEMQGSGFVSGPNVAQISSSMLSPLLPKSFLSRAVLSFLEDVPVLPASAFELPLEDHQLEKPGSIIHRSDSQPLVTLHRRVKPASSFELHQSTELLDESQGKTRKISGSGFSVFLFRMATLALILFCLIRGFCKLTRTALTIVL